MVLIVGVVYAIVGFIFSMVTGGGSSSNCDTAATCEITGNAIETGAGDCGTANNNSGGLAGSGGLVFITLAPNMIALALIGFGLSGEVFMRQADMSLWASLAPAAIAGYGLMFFVNNYIYLPLQRTDNTAKSAQSFVGLTVEVTENIRGTGLGSVRGSAGQKAFHYAAKSNDGNDILTGEQAVILSVLPIAEGNCMVIEKITVNNR